MAGSAPSARRRASRLPERRPIVPAVFRRRRPEPPGIRAACRIPRSSREPARSDRRSAQRCRCSRRAPVPECRRGLRRCGAGAESGPRHRSRPQSHSPTFGRHPWSSAGGFPACPKRPRFPGRVPGCPRDHLERPTRGPEPRGLNRRIQRDALHLDPDGVHSGDGFGNSGNPLLDRNGGFRQTLVRGPVAVENLEDAGEVRFHAREERPVAPTGESQQPRRFPGHFRDVALDLGRGVPYPPGGTLKRSTRVVQLGRLEARQLGRIQAGGLVAPQRFQDMLDLLANDVVRGSPGNANRRRRSRRLYLGPGALPAQPRRAHAASLCARRNRAPRQWHSAITGDGRRRAVRSRHLWRPRHGGLRAHRHGAVIRRQNGPPARRYGHRRLPAFDV